MAAKKTVTTPGADAASKDAGATASGPSYTKADKKLIGLLQDKGIKLTGKESPEELEVLGDENGLGEDAGPEVIEGVPNKMDVRFEAQEAGDSAKPFPVWFVEAVKGGFAMYDQRGVRISHLLVAGKRMGEDGDGPDEVSYHRKVAARANAMRKANRLPNDPA